MSWRELRVICEQSARDTDSPIARSVSPNHTVWTPTVQMLSAIQNHLAVLVWHGTKDGQSKTPQHRPEPILPPWVTDPRKSRFGNDALSIDEMNEWLGW